MKKIEGMFNQRYKTRLDHFLIGVMLPDSLLLLQYQARSKQINLICASFIYSLHEKMLIDGPLSFHAHLCADIHTFMNGFEQVLHFYVHDPSKKFVYMK